MQGKHRSHLQLQMGILKVIAVDKLDPYLFTQILYKSEMSTNQLKGYLLEMATKGLLTVELTKNARVASKEYKITEKGRIILTAWLQFESTWQMLMERKPIDKVHNNHH